MALQYIDYDSILPIILLANENKLSYKALCEADVTEVSLPNNWNILHVCAFLGAAETIGDAFEESRKAIEKRKKLMMDTKMEMKSITKETFDINQQDCAGHTPLHLAVMFGHLDAAQVLRDYEADMHIRSNNGLTAIGLSRSFAFDRISEYLIGSISLEEDATRFAKRFYDQYLLGNMKYHSFPCPANWNHDLGLMTTDPVSTVLDWPSGTRGKEYYCGKAVAAILVQKPKFFGKQEQGTLTKRPLTPEDLDNSAMIASRAFGKGNKWMMALDQFEPFSKSTLNYIAKTVYKGAVTGEHLFQSHQNARMKAGEAFMEKAKANAVYRLESELNALLLWLRDARRSAARNRKNMINSLMRVASPFVEKRIREMYQPPLEAREITLQQIELWDLDEKRVLKVIVQIYREQLNFGLIKTEEDEEFHDAWAETARTGETHTRVKKWLNMMPDQSRDMKQAQKKGDGNESDLDSLSSGNLLSVAKDVKTKKKKNDDDLAAVHDSEGSEFYSDADSIGGDDSSSKLKQKVSKFANKLKRIVKRSKGGNKADSKDPSKAWLYE